VWLATLWIWSSQRTRIVVQLSDSYDRPSTVKECILAAASVLMAGWMTISWLCSSSDFEGPSREGVVSMVSISTFGFVAHNPISGN
jgi:hypothetical protein